MTTAHCTTLVTLSNDKLVKNEHRAYVLHVRPYTDSRLLIDFFTEQSGLVRAVGRTPAKRSPSLFQYFQLLSIEYWGGGDLKTLRSCEISTGMFYSLSKESLYCGFYLNELLERVLPLEDCYPQLFAYYEATIAQLSKINTRKDLEALLRAFEFFLLEQLGFALQLELCCDTGELVEEEKSYYFAPESGVFSEYTLVKNTELKKIAGRHLLLMAKHDFSDDGVLKSAKAVTRLALQTLLGPRPLKTKELFR